MVSYGIRYEPETTMLRGLEEEAGCHVTSLRALIASRSGHIERKFSMRLRRGLRKNRFISITEVLHIILTYVYPAMRRVVT
ncbi:hypothetical protein Bcen2424_6192 [Burkholderia cenocepacia HI2424]|nr:hypothetical protein Bcen2424_6192 [Burkholderia cenocepacia HI2424]